jgi:uncharacterized protein with ATP-grasp and redox domains
MILVNGEKKTAKEVARDAMLNIIGNLMDMPFRGYNEQAFENASPKEKEAMTKYITDYSNKVLKMIKMDLHYQYGDSLPTEGLK